MIPVTTGSKLFCYHWNRFRTFVQNDVLLLTDVLVITRFLRVNKASPATRVINQNMTEICFAADAFVNKFTNNGQSILISIFQQKSFLVIRRIFLMISGHTDIQNRFLLF